MEMRCWALTITRMKVLFISLFTVIIMVSLVLCKNDSFKCPTQFCSCTQKLTKVSCISNGKTLSYIPAMPKHLEYLVYTGNYLTNITRATFRNITSSRLYFLQLIDNNIKFISRNAFTGLLSLNRLDLSNNYIKEFGFDLPFVLRLKLINTTLSNAHNFASLKAPILKSLDISRNLFTIFHSSLFENIKSIQSLHINENPFRVLKNNSISSLKSLRVLAISNGGGFLSKIEKSAFNCTSLGILDLSENKHAFRKGRFDPENMFKFVPNIVQLNLNGINLPSDTVILQTLLGPLKKLQTLELSKVGWSRLPTRTFGLFPLLTKLYLSSNYINGWSGIDVFGNVTSLERLFLAANNINLINKASFPKPMRKSLMRLDLSRNPFSCTCELLWFRNFMKSSNISFKQYSSDYKCISPPELKFRLLKDFNPTEKGCEKPFDSRIIIAVTVSSVIGFSFAISTGIIYKCRWHIRYGIYLFRSRKRRKGYHQILNDEEFIYDGFVIYCEEDSEWVHGELLTYLETKQGLRLCVHYRDFDVGKLIIDNIVMNMDISRKLICVLSNNFTKSKWCQFELQLAQDRILNAGSDALILIMLTGIDSHHINSSLRALITTTTYAAWTDEEIGQNLFWEQIITAVERPLNLASIY